MKIATFLTALLALITLSQSAVAGDLFVVGDFAAAQGKAKASGKLVMIDFAAEWCGPCKMLDRTTWQDEGVISAVTEKAVAVRVDVDENRELAAQFRIRSIPTIIFIDGEGKEVSRLIGYRDAEGFLEEFQKLGKS
jgi:thioredoxin|tara:strand:+ start:555 stop:962 length:408 start_codon:yes stop_codon:yes gene_type:complete